MCSPRFSRRHSQLPLLVQRYGSYIIPTEVWVPTQTMPASQTSLAPGCMLITRTSRRIDEIASLFYSISRCLYSNSFCSYDDVLPISGVVDGVTSLLLRASSSVAVR